MVKWAMSSHERAATRYCSKCLKTKELEDFSVKAVWCKGCINAYSKEHYQCNQARILARKAIYRSTHDEQIKIGQAVWRSKNVGRLTGYLKQCGLHVLENLRIIPYLENCKKRNSMPVEDIV